MKLIGRCRVGRYGNKHFGFFLRFSSVFSSGILILDNVIIHMRSRTLLIILALLATSCCKAQPESNASTVEWHNLQATITKLNWRGKELVIEYACLFPGERGDWIVGPYGYCSIVFSDKHHNIILRKVALIEFDKSFANGSRSYSYAEFVVAPPQDAQFISISLGSSQLETNPIPIPSRAR
jgi:hypothetical protein